jgi:hypothetical protein
LKRHRNRVARLDARAAELAGEPVDDDVQLLVADRVSGRGDERGMVVGAPNER